MKKVILMLMFFAALFVNTFKASAIKLSVSVSSKSYWNGTGCTPREKGGCVHIEIGTDLVSGTFNGELNNDGKGNISIVISRTNGITDEDFNTYFKDGVFSVGGPLTFDPKTLEGVGYDGSSQFTKGSYPYTVKGDIIIIQLN